jgi:hypothetical protein
MFRHGPRDEYRDMAGHCVQAYEKGREKGRGGKGSALRGRPRTVGGKQGDVEAWVAEVPLQVGIGQSSNESRKPIRDRPALASQW